MGALGGDARRGVCGGLRQALTPDAREGCAAAWQRVLSRAASDCAAVLSPASCGARSRARPDKAAVRPHQAACPPKGGTPPGEPRASAPPRRAPWKCAPPAAPPCETPTRRQPRRSGWRAARVTPAWGGAPGGVGGAVACSPAGDAGSAPQPGDGSGSTLDSIRAKRAKGRSQGAGACMCARLERICVGTCAAALAAASSASSAATAGWYVRTRSRSAAAPVPDGRHPGCIICSADAGDAPRPRATRRAARSQSAGVRAPARSAWPDGAVQV